MTTSIILSMFSRNEYRNESTHIYTHILAFEIEADRNWDGKKGIEKSTKLPNTTHEY